jgi:uncharacterized membrane protein
MECCLAPAVFATDERWRKWKTTNKTPILRRVTPEKRKKNKMQTQKLIKIGAARTTALGLTGLATLLALASPLPTSGANNQQQYILQDFAGSLETAPLEALGAGPSAWGNNNRGQIVGNFPKFASDNVTVLWDGFLFENGTFIDVVVPGYSWSSLIKINDNGVAVGNTFPDANLDTIPSQVFVRYPDGTIDFLPPVIVGAVFRAWNVGINNENTIAGSFTVNPNLPTETTQGFVLKHGVYTVFNYPDPDAVETLLTDINNNGTISGRWFDSQGNYHGFVRYKDGSLVPVEFPGAVGTVTHGLNNQDQVVGWYFDTDYNVHGFVLSKGVYTTLDFPNDGGNSEALGINDEGVVVGTYGWDSNYAFIATPVHYHDYH